MLSLHNFLAQRSTANQENFHVSICLASNRSKQGEVYASLLYWDWLAWISIF